MDIAPLFVEIGWYRIEDSLRIIVYMYMFRCEFGAVYPCIALLPTVNDI